MKEHLADVFVGDGVGSEPAVVVQDESPDLRRRPDPSRLSGDAQRKAAHTESRERRDEALLATLVPAAKLNGAPERVFAVPPFLTKVEILPWPRPFAYYESFVREAERLQSVRGRPCGPVEYFSYIPQYGQMTNAQLAYYLWFRDCADAGKYLPPHAVSASYVMLYVYEIINLGERIPPATGAARLAGVWLAYRERYRELTKYLAEWLCDYCLVHETPLPDSVKDSVSVLAGAAFLREFYLCSLVKDGIPTLSGEILTTTVSEYDYRTSRYYAANAKAFDGAIPAALDRAAAAMNWTTENPLRESVSERDAYCGALCGARAKRRIRVTYLSISRSGPLRTAVTACVRCAENCLRTALRISSRLKEGNVPEAARAAIEAYFAPLLPKKKTVPERPEWERLYDAPKEALDPVASRRIETESWENAERLGGSDPEDGDDVPEETAVPAEVETPGETDAPATDDGGGEGAAPLTPTLRRVLAACLAGSTFRDACAAVSIPARDLDRTAGEINEALEPLLSDAALEQTPAGWTIIKDYEEEIRGAVE